MSDHIWLITAAADWLKANVLKSSLVLLYFELKTVTF